MLSEQLRVVVEATLPAVADNIGEIARRFYAHMFLARPEVMDGLFHRGNETQGAQQVALSVYARRCPMFRVPRCSVISSFGADSSTDVVHCLKSPSGPVRHRPLFPGRRTSSMATAFSAEGSGFVFVGTTSGVVITARPR